MGGLFQPPGVIRGIDASSIRMQGDAAAAQAVVKKSIADPATLAAAQKLAEVVLSQAAVQSFGHSLGSLFAGRRLLDVSPRL